MKKILYILLLCISYTAQAQLYAPEIKVKDTGNGGVGIGTTNPGSKFHIVAEGDGVSVLRLGIERPWDFVQKGVGGSTILSLRSTSNSKRFNIESPNTTTNAQFWPNDVPASNKILLIPGGGRIGVGSYNVSIDHTLFVEGGAYMSNGSWQGSDRKLKKNIKKFEKGLSIIKEVNTVTYDYKTDSTHNNSQRVGVIAQELQQIAPYLVKNIHFEDGREELAIDPSGLTYILINAVKEQQQEIESLENRIVSLEKKLEK